MSTDEKKLELLNSTLTTSTIDTELKEIKFDDWDNSELITVTADVQLQDGDAFTVHNDIVTGGLGQQDVITVTLDDLDLDNIDTSSNGIKQMDLFNGWPEDGDPVTVTVNKNYDDE
jgi:hypothetical protein|tara:strand:+ start:962 stop:1309 length:348 start_codon:yes stop_codon:yes gene_type:complete